MASAQDASKTKLYEEDKVHRLEYVENQLECNNENLKYLDRLCFFQMNAFSLPGNVH